MRLCDEDIAQGTICKECGCIIDFDWKLNTWKKGPGHPRICNDCLERMERLKPTTEK